MRDEQFVADMEHGVVHVVRTHDQLWGGFQFLCNPRDHVPLFHDVFLLFGRGNGRKQQVHVYCPEQILRFLEMLAAGIFLNEHGEGITRLHQFAFLP